MKLKRESDRSFRSLFLLALSGLLAKDHHKDRFRRSLFLLALTDLLATDDHFDRRLEPH